MKSDKSINHRHRIEALIEQKYLERVPVALWRHFPIDDQKPETLAKAIIEFQTQFDFDLIKITPASSFQVKDWGAKDIWKGNPEGTREYTQRVIQKPDDWLKLTPLKVSKGWLAGQLQCASLVTKQTEMSVPVLQTVFSPLAQAKNLAGGEKLITHLRQYPDIILHALKVIAETTIGFIEALGHTKIDGIFYAVQHAQYSLLTRDEFIRFGKAFDLPVLKAASSFWCNMLHVHGENLMFDQIKDYPVVIINWHDRNTPPNLKEGMKQTSGIVCGGLQQWQTLVLGDPTQVYKEARMAIKMTGGRRLLLGTGCVTPVTAPFGNIMAARKSVESLK